MSTYELMTVETRRGLFKTRVFKGGQGPGLVYLHGALGIGGWEPQLQALSRHFTVHAPVQPGVGESEGLEHLDDLWDLVLYYYELFDALGLDAPAVVGHSFGGMVAAELAATDPGRVSRLVLVSAIGLWRDDHPVADYWVEAVTPEASAALTFHDPRGMVAHMVATAMPMEERARNDHVVRLIINQAATGKFFWPIPDKGLNKRIHRIQAPTLVIWGKSDRVVPPFYAEEFGRRIPGARVELLDGAGHAPQWERLDRFAQLVTEFCQAERVERKGA